mgnify:FL=1
MIVELETIKKIVEEYTNVDMTVQNRTKYRCEARHIYSYLARKYSGHIFETIGESIKRNHATILHGVKVCNNLKDTEKEFHDRLYDIELIVKSKQVITKSKKPYHKHIINPLRLRGANTHIKDYFKKR